MSSNNTVTMQVEGPEIAKPWPKVSYVARIGKLQKKALFTFSTTKQVTDHFEAYFRRLASGEIPLPDGSPLGVLVDELASKLQDATITHDFRFSGGRFR